MTRYNIKKNEYGEYVVRCFEDGKYNEDKSYFTDDLKDAQATMKTMMKGSII